MSGLPIFRISSFDLGVVCTAVTVEYNRRPSCIFVIDNSLQIGRGRLPFLRVKLPEKPWSSFLVSPFQPASVRISLSRLPPPEIPDQNAKEDKCEETRYESYGFNRQVILEVAWVHHCISHDVGLICGGVGGVHSVVIRQLCVVMLLQRVHVLHGVNFTVVTHVLAVVRRIVEDLIFPHVKIQKHDDEDNPIIKPFTWKEKSVWKYSLLKLIYCDCFYLLIFLDHDLKQNTVILNKGPHQLFCIFFLWFHHDYYTWDILMQKLKNGKWWFYHWLVSRISKAKDYFVPHPSYLVSEIHHIATCLIIVDIKFYYYISSNHLYFKRCCAKYWIPSSTQRKKLPAQGHLWAAALTQNFFCQFEKKISWLSSLVAQMAWKRWEGISAIVDPWCLRSKNMMFR